MGYYEEYRRKKAEQKKSGEPTGYYKKWLAENRGAELLADMQSRVQSWVGSHNSFLKDYADRFGGRDDYTATGYMGDAQDWYDRASTRGEELRASADSLLEDLRRDSYIYGEDYIRSVSDLLTSGRDTYSLVTDTAKRDIDFWKQFDPTEEQASAGYDTAEKVYTAWQQDNKYRARHTGKTRDEIERAILYAEDETEAQWLRQRATELWTADDEQARLDRAETERQRLYTIGGADYFSADELRRMDYLMDTIEDSRGVIGRLEEREKYGYLHSNEDFEQLSAYDPAIASGDYAYLNMSKADRAAHRKEMLYTDIEAGDETGDSAAANHFEKLDKMTADEIAGYNYLYRKEGEQSAAAYLEWLEQAMQGRVAEAVSERAADYANEHPWAASGFSVATSLGSGVEYMKNAAGYLVDKASSDPDAKMDTNISSLVTNAVRGKVSENTNWMIGNWDAFDFLYNTGMSGLDSLAASTVLGNAGGAVLGLSAAAQGTQDAIDRGMSNDRAFWNGLFSGVFEGLFENVSIGNFNALKEVAPKSIKDVFKNIAKSMLVNASEESLTEIANIGYDTLANGEFANYTIEDLKNGTWKQALGQVVEAGTSGALMGAGFGGIGSAAGYVSRKTENTTPKDGVKFKLVGYTQEQQNNWKNSKRIVIYEGIEQFKTFIKNALFGEDKTNKKMYFGSVDSQLAAAIFTETGVEVEGYNLSLGENEVRKINKDHGNEEKEVPRGQRAVTEVDYLQIPEVVQSPDSIKLSPKEYNGKPVIEFRKTAGNETTVVAAVVSDKRLDLFVQTTYINVKKGSIATPKSEQADFNTPEAGSGTAPNNSIPNSAAGVNGENLSPLAALAAEKVDLENGADEVASAEGRVIYQDQVLDVVDIADAGGGKVSLQLQDGRSVDASELSFPDDGEGELWRVIGKYAENAESARALLDEYRLGDLDAYTYARGVEEAFLYGKVGITSGEMEQQGTYVNKLSHTQRNMAYEQGRIAARKKAQQAKKSGSNKSGEKKKGALHFEGDREMLTARQKVSLQTCEIVAKALGIQVYVFESRKVDGKRVGDNGWYDPKDGSIHIDLHAGQNGEGVMVFTLAHELTHFIRDWSPAKFRTLSVFLAEQYAQKGLSVTDLVRVQQRKAAEDGRQLSFEEAHEEWVADSVEKMLTDGAVAEKLAMLQAKDKSLAEKIRDFLTGFVKRLKAAYELVSPQTTEGRIVADMVDAASKLQDLFTDALLDAGANFQAAEKNTTDEGGVRHQRRDDRGIEDKYYKRLIDSWDGQDHGGAFRIGKPSQALLSVGIPDVDIWFDQSKAKKQLEGKSEIDKNILKKIPDILGNPIAITESYDNTVVVFGKVFDDFGHPIVVALRVNSTNRRNHITLVNKIRSVGTRNNNLDTLLAESAILYLSANKKETNRWFNALGRSTPFGGTKFGLIRSITFDLPSVNKNDSTVNKLSHTQRNMAYEQGRIAARKKAQQAKKSGSNKSGEKKKGALHFEGDREMLTARQKVSLQTCEIVAKALGIQVYVFESRKVDGKRVGDNGWYDPKDGSIHIDLHAGQNGEGVMVFTLAHELTHFIRDWSPAKFRTLSVFLAEQYAQRGLSVTDLVRVQQRKAAEDGRQLSFEEAHEEWVADSMEKMLTDGAIVEKLAMLQAKDKSLAEKIRDFLTGFAKRLKAAYELVSPQTTEGRIVADMVDATSKLQDLFTDALLDAGANFQAAEKNTTDEAGVKEQAVRRSARIVDQIQANIAAIMELESVYTIDSSNAAPYTGIHKNDETSGRSVFKAQGNAAVRPGFGRVVLGRKGVVNTVFHGNGPAKQAAFPAIKAVIEKGVKIGEDINHKGRGYDTVTFGAPIDFYGTKSPLGVVVQVFVNGRGDKSFYIHEICDAEGNYIELVNGAPKKKEISSTGLVDSSSTAGTAEDGIAPNDSIRNSAEVVKKNDSTEKRSSSRSGSVSDRTMLVDLFEQMVTSSAEYEALQKYKRNIDRMLSLEENVDRLSAEIRRVSFEPGPRNMEYLDNLRTQRKEAVAELDRYDNILLRLEKSGVLRSMIERNRTVATQESYKKAREYYRKKSESREAEIRQYYRESRRKATERHDRSQMRQKLKRVVRDLWRLQETAPKDRRTKEELREFAEAAIQAADLVWLERYDEYDMIHNGVGVDLRGNEAKILEECRELLEKHMDVSGRDVDTRWDIEGALQQAKDKAALDKELAKRMKILRDAGVFAAEFERVHKMDAGQLIDNMLAAYEKLSATESPYLQGAYQEAIPIRLAEVREEIGARPVRELSLQELEKLYELYGAILHVVRSANKQFFEDRAATIYDLGTGAVEELEGYKRTSKSRMFIETLKKFNWNNLTPAYVFRWIGSQTLERLYKNMVSGMGIYGKDIAEGKVFWQKQAKRYGANKWDMTRRKVFLDSTGKEFSLSLGQMMSVYALSRRKQANKHLEIGGIMLDNSEAYIENIVDKLLPKVITDAGTYKLDRTVIDGICSKLTKEQRDFVDATQEYLSTVLADKGNEVSMKLYGLKLFKEKHYFPLRTASQTRYESTELINQSKLKNSGFTKETKPDAANAVVISDYSSVWTGHVNQMSLYHGMTLAMEDMDRVLNFGKTFQRDENGEPVPITAGMSDAKRYALLKNRSITVKAKTNVEALHVVEKLLEQNIEGMDAVTEASRKKLFRKMGEEFGIFKEYTNADVRLTFNFSRGNMRESVSKQRKKYADFAKMLSCFEEIIDSAIGIEAHNRNTEGYKFDPTLKNVYVLVSAFQDGDNIVPVKLEIKEFIDKDNALYVAIALEPIKKDEVIKQGNTEYGVTQNSRSSTISIADLFSKINPADRSFLKYIPHQFFIQTEDVEQNSVCATLQNIYGSHPENYIRELMKQLNGGVRTSGTEDLSGKMLSRFKKASVAASLSVWIQQWTSVFRAIAYVPLKYFIQKPLTGKFRSSVIAEMKEHCPIAVIKEMGGFDTAMGQSAHDYITLAEPANAKESLQEFKKHPLKRLDALTGWLPGRADEDTWAHIWTAVKRETLEKHPDLQRGSDAFYKTASDRFTEVINLTQVYDSVLSKSAMMRSKDFGTKMVTQFASEPTVVLNMTVDALHQIKRTGKVPTGVAMALAGSIIANAMSSALIYAMRDDDDETFLEKYVESLTGNMLDGINPLTYIPIIRDIWSAFQGYDVKRSDMELWAQLASSMEAVARIYADPDATELEKAEAWAGASDWAFSIIGIPAKNARRELKGFVSIWNTLEKDIAGRKTTGGSIADTMEEAFWSSVPLARLLYKESKADKLLDAYIAGDTHYAERLRGTYKTEEAATTAIVKEIRKRFEAGDLEKWEAISLLTKYAGKTDNKAQDYLDKWQEEVTE